MSKEPHEELREAQSALADAQKCIDSASVRIRSTLDKLEQHAGGAPAGDPKPDGGDDQ